MRLCFDVPPETWDGPFRRYATLKAFDLTIEINLSGCAGHNRWCLLSDVLSLIELGRVTKVVTLRTQSWRNSTYPHNTPRRTCQWQGCRICGPTLQHVVFSSSKLNSVSTESTDRMCNTKSWLTGWRRGMRGLLLTFAWAYVKYAIHRLKNGNFTPNELREVANLYQEGIYGTRVDGQS